MIPRQIINLIIDITDLAQKFSDIQFSHRNRSENSLADKIAKLVYCTSSDLYHCDDK